MSPVVWVGALFLLGLLVLVAEVFIPSGGVLGFVSFSSFVASIAIAYLQLGPGPGTVMLLLAVMAIPVVLGMAFRWFPETPLGRRVLPPPPLPEDVLPDGSRRRRLRELVGRRGTAEGDLLPWGRVRVEGESLEAMSESGPIDDGAEIDVVGAQGGALVVRRRAPAPRVAVADGAPLRPAAGTAESPPVTGERPSDRPDRLSPTLEAFTFESLDSPDA